MSTSQRTGFLGRVAAAVRAGNRYREASQRELSPTVGYLGAGDDLVIEEQLEVPEFLFRRGVVARTVIDEFATLDPPMRESRLRILFRHRLRPGGDLSGALGFRERHQLAVVIGCTSPPAGEIPAVEQRGESGRRSGGGKSCGHGEQDKR